MTRLLGILVPDETARTRTEFESHGQHRLAENRHWSARTSHEFTAIAPNGIDIRRVYRIDDGPLKGRWRWVFLLGHLQFRQGIMSGDQASKQRAANQV